MIPDDRRWSRTDLVVMTMFVSSDVELWSENGGWTYDLTLDVGSLAQAMPLRSPSERTRVRSLRTSRG